MIINYFKSPLGWILHATFLELSELVNSRILVYLQSWLYEIWVYVSKSYGHYKSNHYRRSAGVQPMPYRTQLSHDTWDLKVQQSVMLRWQQFICFILTKLKWYLKNPEENMSYHEQVTDLPKWPKLLLLLLCGYRLVLKVIYEWVTICCTGRAWKSTHKYKTNIHTHTHKVGCDVSSADMHNRLWVKVSQVSAAAGLRGYPHQVLGATSRPSAPTHTQGRGGMFNQQAAIIYRLLHILYRLLRSDDGGGRESNTVCRETDREGGW